jgi:nucleoside-diphosphate-sugar epimerase
VRILVLGGTQFVGRAAVEAALADGHEVTLFHRGQTGAGLFPDAEHVLGDRDGGLDVLRGRTWDGCLDVSGYVPRVVRQSVELLQDAVGRYAFVSSISAYAELRVPADESAPLATLEDETTEEVGGGTYGALKALCERVVADAFGAGSAIVRPTFVVGSHDHTGRFTSWVHRGARGGEVLVPESSAWRVQIIDARDLGRFLVRAATEEAIAGPYNVVGPQVEIGLVDVIEEAATLAGAKIRPVVVDDAFLLAQEVTTADLPLWVPEPDAAAWAQVRGERAVADGLLHTPVVDTIQAVLDDAVLVDGVGLTAEREAELLGAWAARESS